MAAAPFRVALAVAVLFMLLVQPAAYARAATSQLQESGPAVVTHDAGVKPQADRHSAPHARNSGHHHGDAVADSHRDNSFGHDHDGGKAMAETCCDLQCSPVAWIPVSHPDVTAPRIRSFEPAEAKSLPLGEYRAAIRPPRP